MVKAWTEVLSAKFPYIEPVMGARFMHAGVMSDQDAEGRYTNVFEVSKQAYSLLCVLWNEVLQREIGFSLTRSTVQRWIDSIGGTELTRQIRTLGWLADTLPMILEEGVTRYPYARIKAWARSLGLVPAMMSLLKPLYVAWVEEEDYTSQNLRFRALFQCASFLSRFNPLLHEKTEMHSDIYDNLEHEAYEKFVSTEKSLPLDPPVSCYTKQWVASLLYNWIEEADPAREYFPLASDARLFRFSSGATAEFRRGTHLFEKASLIRQIPYEIAETMWYLTGDDWLGMDHTANRAFLPWRWEGDISYDIPPAECQTVPKSAKALRLITKEPTILVWYMQGLAATLANYLDRHFSKRYHSVDGPPTNRSYAIVGSLTGRYATVDLSCASDSVSVVLLRALLSHLPYTFACLMLGRSTTAHMKYADVDQTIELAKFAGMGNPLTFKLEVVVFAAACVEAIRLCGEDPESSEFRIVGDDIVIEVQYVDALFDVLQSWGFTVNEDKTYCSNDTPHCFRESCGAFGVDGLDVTPVRLSRSFPLMRRPSRHERVTGRMNSIWPVQAIDLANDLLHGGFRQTRAALITIILALLPRKWWPLFDSDGSRGIASATPTNFHLERVEPPKQLVAHPLDVRLTRYYGKWATAYIGPNEDYVKYGRLRVRFAKDTGKLEECLDQYGHKTVQRTHSEAELYWFYQMHAQSYDERLAVSLVKDLLLDRLNASDFTEASVYQTGWKPQLSWETGIAALDYCP